ncbi:MAG: indole-3-glycerol phosphate synthase [Fluviicola sp.]|nr:MAG: indole-3-glycerol phosphate synthase [Fluviicola sp.]
MNILTEIIAHKRQEVEHLKKQVSRKNLEDSEFFKLECNSLSDSIRSKNFGIIAEMKRKSPSAGAIRTDLNPTQLGKRYSDSGVAGISVLTDNKYFGGHYLDLLEVKKEVETPVLRKDFIVDEYQIFESKAMGADCILLIASVLEKQHLKELALIANSLGLEVLMEVHEHSELEKFNDEISILGVNNRDLKKQATDLSISEKLRPYLPNDITLISESGIKTSKETEFLASLGYHGALIGESIVGNKNPSAKIESFQLKTVTQ